MLHDRDFDLAEEKQHFAAAGFSPLAMPWVLPTLLDPYST